MTTALFIGRFQPFHKGHLSAIKEIISENDKVVIAIGSPKESRTERNPFTAEQRLEMITLALNEAKLTNYEIIEIGDATGKESWVEKAKAAAKFDVVYTSDNLRTRQCFVDAEVPVKLTTFVEPYSSTLIREKMSKAEPWKELVPPAVHNYILKLKSIPHPES